MLAGQAKYPNKLFGALKYISPAFCFRDTDRLIRIIHMDEVNKNIESNNRAEKIKRQQEEEFAQGRANMYKLPYLDLETTPVQIDALKDIEEKIARKLGMAVIKKSGTIIQIAILDPKNKKFIALIKKYEKSYKQVDVFVVSKSGLEKLWSNYSSIRTYEEPITDRMKTSAKNLEEFKDKITSVNAFADLLEKISKTDATQAFDLMLGAALSLDATDIHIEPQETTTIIRMKLDGILYEVSEIDEHLYKLLLSRIKLISKLKLNIHDSPQEGRFSITFEKREIEIRTSILPSAYNEDIALRILDPKHILSLENLGLRKDLAIILKDKLKEPQGLILATGPTGSGKTTTLYASINFLKNDTIKIITIEDPIEYHLEGITQTQTSPNDNYTFESGLKAILRQDPSIILISELRSLEAAESALQASLAGRKVLSTLHTIDATATIPRLMDLGIAATTISSALSTVIAQRLIRKLCVNCKEKVSATNKQLKSFKKILKNLPKNIETPQFTKNVFIYSASKSGCMSCRKTGYKGRLGIFEIMIITDLIKKKIDEGPSETEMRTYAKSYGMTTLLQDATIKVLLGITSIKEIERMLGEVK